MVFFKILRDGIVFFKILRDGMVYNISSGKSKLFLHKEQIDFLLYFGMTKGKERLLGIGSYLKHTPAWTSKEHRKYSGRLPKIT